jgi:RNA polymerase sigma-70 factor (ECF subfamily)
MEKGDQVDDSLTERFEEQRGQLQAIAYRLLGSAAEAQDAVQETWLRVARADVGAVENLAAWLRTVVTRICLDMLRSRSRREHLTADGVADQLPAAGNSPEDEALLADSVSRALLVVLDALAPAERIALVLHDMFAVPFTQIGPIVDRTPETAKKLASRARQKVRGTPAVPTEELARQRRVVTAFLEAARAGDLPGVLAVLAPDVIRKADPAILPPGTPAEIRGARAVAEGTMLFSARSKIAELALINGEVGAIVASGAHLLIALTFTIDNDKISEYEVIANPHRLGQLTLALALPSDSAASAWGDGAIAPS